MSGIAASRSRVLTIILLAFALVTAAYIWLSYTLFRDAMDNTDTDIYLTVIFYHMDASPELISDYLAAALKRCQNINSVASTIYSVCTDEDEDQDKHDAVNLLRVALKTQPENADFHALYARILEKSGDSAGTELAALAEYERARELGLKTLELNHLLCSSMWYLQTEPTNTDKLDPAAQCASQKLLTKYHVSKENIEKKLDEELNAALKLHPRSPALLQLRATHKVFEAIENNAAPLWKDCLNDCNTLEHLETPEMPPGESYIANEYYCPRLNLESYAMYALGQKDQSLKRAKQAFEGVLHLAEEEHSESERNFAYATLADYYGFIEDFSKAEDCLKHVVVRNHDDEDSTFRENITTESLDELLQCCKNKTQWVPTFPNP